MHDPRRESRRGRSSSRRRLFLSFTHLLVLVVPSAPIVGSNCSGDCIQVCDTSQCPSRDLQLNRPPPQCSIIEAPSTDRDGHLRS
jgi:hypothetical protein